MNIRNRNPGTERSHRKGRARVWPKIGLLLLLLVLLAGIGRALMPSFVRDYANKTLDRSQLYSGRIGEIRIHLWRGGYSIHDVTISKRTGDIPVPLFAARRVDFTLQWDALLHRRLVGRVLMVEPELNFVDAATEEEQQTGAGDPWLLMIQDLFPFRINSAVVQNGSIHFRAYHRKVPVNVYLSRVNATIENLGNIRDETAPLVATVEGSAQAMDHARLEFKMSLDPFSYRPTFNMALRLLGLDLTHINDLAQSYGYFDFEAGWLDLVVETESKEGQFTGYVKPLFRNLQVFSLRDNLRDGNVLQLFWEALLGALTTAFKNWPRDQFGTVIPFSGDATGTTTDILATAGNILRNAFIRAFLPRLEDGDVINGLRFHPPEIADPLSPIETL